jgi:quercetin dioxygenase-like cupin family protein
MKVFHAADRRAEPLDPVNFTGTGTLVRMPGVGVNPAINAYRVSFEPGTRTAWHAHTGTQLLVVTEGICRCQKEGEPVQEVAAGDIVAIEAGERHWHGASPAGPMTHIALNIDASTTWFEKVSDEEYEGS